MKALLVVAAILFTNSAFATFKSECLPPLRGAIAKEHHAEKQKVTVGKANLIVDASRDKLCGVRMVYGVPYSVKKTFEGQEYTTNGFLMIEYTCNGCETIKDYQDIN